MGRDSRNETESRPTMSGINLTSHGTEKDLSKKSNKIA